MLALISQGVADVPSSRFNILIPIFVLPQTCAVALNDQTLQYLKSLFILTSKKHVICMRT